MQHLSADELDELRAALDGEKTSLEEELADHGKKVGNDWQGSVKGENEADETDMADTMEELAVNVPLVEELESRYKEICAAIKRVADGTYGLDSETGDPIDVERLRANPAATRNI